jgi:putative DNA-invertase from lambdoid prophage Rac
LKTLLDVNRLASCGVKVRSLREPWLDPESPTYGLLLPVFAWIAQQEARRIGERTRAGLARARAAGVRLGRPPLAPEVVVRIKTLKADGLGVRKIARSLKISAASVSKILSLKPTSSPSGA